MMTDRERFNEWLRWHNYKVVVDMGDSVVVQVGPSVLDRETHFFAPDGSSKGVQVTSIVWSRA